MDMKVIGTDSFNRDTVSDILHSDGLTESAAREVAERLNAKASDFSRWYYIAVPDDYKLYGWEPEL